MQFASTSGAIEPPTNRNLGAAGGGAWLGLQGPNGHYVGPHGGLSTRIQQMICQTHPKGDRRVSQEVEF